MPLFVPMNSPCSPSRETSISPTCALSTVIFSAIFTLGRASFGTSILPKMTAILRITPNLEAAAHSLFAQLARENHLAGLDPPAFSARAAYYLSELNALHPFRDGNGRAQREFISHLAYENGCFIDWSSISKADLVNASVESFRTGDFSLFSEIIRTNLRKRLKPA